MAQPLSFRWDEDFVAALDAARGSVKRSTYVREAVAEKMAAARPRAASSPGTVAHGRQPKVTHPRPTTALIAPSSARRHLPTCKCLMCQPKGKAK